MISMKKSIHFRLILTLSFIWFAFAGNSCKKETDYIYGVTDVDLYPPGADKPNVKSTTEFISIAYSDIFGTTIPQDKLIKLQLAYSAFGDQKLIEELVVRNFLNQPANAIPTQAEMSANPEQFIKDTYIKFFSRKPDEYEFYYFKTTLAQDPALTPELVYYAMMTSNEYRYY